MEAPSTKRFTIRRRLGEGGMGVVYEAFDEDRRTPVALKTLNRVDGGALARFKREFRALQELAHPNLVALDELFSENQQWFFTMELLDGVDFVSHVTGRAALYPFGTTVSSGVTENTRPSATAHGAWQGRGLSFDAQKLREGLRQLLEGLTALHASDKVHRDIKPSNVLVTREGRVVLLDFGLVTAASAHDRTTGNALVGTPAYMAPEQAASREVGPAADLYAVGVMLYEVLTGRLPFDGAPLQVLVDKQAREPPPPSSVVSSLPEDLDALCAALLRLDPALRPSAADVLSSGTVTRTSGVTLRPAAPEGPIFVGRSAELAELRAAFSVTLNGDLATVLVCGESGVGKSYLVRRFTESVLAERPEALLLEGRCYERETVPYKAIDGVVDSLSRRLSRMSPTEAGALLPTRCAVLAQVFPAMLRVPQVAAEHAARATVLEPHELRQRAFAALRDLFTRVAARRPTIVVIDDLQWADDDGLRALAEILSQPEAPPLLLLGTVRRASGDDATLQRLRAVIPDEPRAINLANLAPDEARALAVAFLERSGANDADPGVIASEAAGHPLFVEELARHVTLGGSARDDVKLDDAIWSRILLLEAPTREMAELVAIAGKPLPQEVAGAAARIEPAEFGRRAAALRVSNIVRTGGARSADAIEPYHDRVREAVLARVTPERRRALHEALAIAFEASPHHDPETLAVHWREAGNAALAARHAAAAGDQASKTSAFDRAAQWYEQALMLTPEADASRRELQVKLGDALASAGRGAMAVPHFEAAAAESPPLLALDLRRRAAEQLLRSGHFDRGIDATRAVLAAIGMRLPRSIFGTLALLLYLTFRLRLRGLRVDTSKAAMATEQDLARIDVCMSVGLTLSFVDSYVGFAFISRSLLLALKCGDLERVVRAFAMLIPGSAASGSSSWRRTQADIGRARALEERSGTHRSHVFVTGCSGAALYLNGKFADGARLLRQSIEAIGDTVPDMVFERVTLRLFHAQTLEFLGGLSELKSLTREMLRDAIARGDIYASVIARTGAPNLAWLVEDHPHLADGNAVQAMRDWSSQGFHLEHFFGLIARVRARLYAGDGEEAHALASECLQRASGSLLGRIQIIRARALYLRAGSALLKVERGRGDRARLLGEAARDARALERERMEWTTPLAAVIRAGIALAGGARDEALRALDRAARGFDGADMTGYAAAARGHAARLRGDNASIVDRGRAVSFFREEGVVAPERFMAMLVPGFGQGTRGGEVA